MFPRNHDSDPSISEEEDFDASSSEDCAISSSGPLEKKGLGLQVLSQLEILEKGVYELDDAVVSSQKRRTGLSIEEEIEFPVFENNNEDDSTHSRRTPTAFDLDEGIVHYPGLASISNSDEDIFADEDKASHSTTGIAKRDRAADTWSEANREVKALVQLNENTVFPLPSGSSSKLKTSSKGGQNKVKPKYLFQFQSCVKDFPSVVSDINDIGMSINSLPETKRLHTIVNREKEMSSEKFMQVLIGKEAEKPNQNLLSIEEATYCKHREHSVTELLDSLQEKSCLFQGISASHKRFKGRRTQVLNRVVTPTGDRHMDEDNLDVRSSSGDEDNSLNPKSLQQRTMVDQFDEAFGAVSPNDLTHDITFHRQSGIGLFEKLQHVILSEKERDMEFMKKSQTDADSRGGRGCIDVKILSRSLEAKMTVCFCAFIGHDETVVMRKQLGERILTIIFSSRICGDADLEVGNLIRVQPPWKEISVGEEDDVIILSTYFCQI